MIVELARKLGLDVIAEGIETPAQLDALRDLGVELGQGFLIGRPAAAGPAASAGRCPPSSASARTHGARSAPRVSRGALARLTYSQFLTASVRSAVTLSWPPPQSIVSRVPSRAEIVSLPPWPLAMSLPARA